MLIDGMSLLQSVLRIQSTFYEFMRNLLVFVLSLILHRFHGSNFVSLCCLFQFLSISILFRGNFILPKTPTFKARPDDEVCGVAQLRNRPAQLMLVSNA